MAITYDPATNIITCVGDATKGDLESNPFSFLDKYNCPLLLVRRRLIRWRVKLRPPSYALKPTAPERRVINIIEKHGLPFKYVGNGRFFIGRKCPDFVSSDKSNRLIEVLGDYWHVPKDEENLKRYYEQKSFKAIFLWESELKKMSDEDVVNKIINGR